MVFLLKTTFVLIDTAKVYHRYKYNDNYSYKINHTSYIKDLFSRDNNRRYPYVTSVQAASLQRLYKLGWRYIINRFKALRKIAETLDMSLQKLLKAAGYDEMSLYFHAHKNKDKYIDKSSKDLKELIEKYKKSELE